MKKYIDIFPSGWQVTDRSDSSGVLRMALTGRIYPYVSIQEHKYITLVQVYYRGKNIVDREEFPDVQSAIAFVEMII